VHQAGWPGVRERLEQRGTRRFEYDRRDTHPDSERQRHADDIPAGVATGTERLDHGGSILQPAHRPAISVTSNIVRDSSSRPRWFRDPG
jgi:hypothetical protein